jgi:gamma-glutamylputrescine oxidase
LSADYIDSYYSRSLHDDHRRAPLTNNIDTSVCVIGGGLAGLATAIGLAERGQSVTLLEARRVGWGASGRNGGFVSAGYAQSMDKIRRRVGDNHARELFQLSRQAMTLIQQRIAKYAIHCGPITPGLLSASWFDQGDHLAAAAAARNDWLGSHYEYWSHQRLRAALSTDRYFDGLYDPDGFTFHALNFSRGIAAAAERLGAQIFEHSAVTSVTTRGHQHKIQTATGTVTADHVVYCCSGYLGWLKPRLAWSTIPVGTYVMVTEPLGERLKTAIRIPHGISDDRIAQDYYRPLADTRLLWGGYVSAVTNPRNLVAKMRTAMAKVYPQLENVAIAAAWPGTMGYATHKMPQIGQLAPGVWYNQGFGGHGMNTTTLGGELIASAIAKADERYRLFAPFGLSFAGGPLAPIAAQAMYWFYQAQDKFRERRDQSAKL